MSKPSPSAPSSSITQYAPSPRCRSQRLDQTRNLRLITEALGRQSAHKLPRLIGVQGVVGSGKTQLASVLVETGVNVRYIDVLQHRWLTADQSYDIASLLDDPTVTYVIDEADYAYQGSLARAVTEITTQHCTVVMLFQRFRELACPLVNAMVQFDLLGGALIERPAELRVVAKQR